MRKLLILFILISNSAHASIFFGIGSSARFIKDSENNYRTKFPISIFGGYKDVPWAYSLEGLYFQDKSNSGSSFKITNNHYEATIYAMRFLGYQEARAINPYAVGGIGVFQSHVKTDFGTSTSKDKSTHNLIVKIGMGARAQLGSKGLVTLETKAMHSRDFSPELVFDISGRVGFEF